MLDPTTLPEPRKAIAKAWVCSRYEDISVEEFFTILDKEEVDEGVFNYLVEWEYDTFSYADFWWNDTPQHHEAEFSLPLCVFVVEWVEPNI